jgi:hypothetical protein
MSGSSQFEDSLHPVAADTAKTRSSCVAGASAQAGTSGATPEILETSLNEQGFYYQPVTECRQRWGGAALK